MGMRTMNCKKCGGSGQFWYTSIHGRVCFTCKGTDIVRYRKDPVPTVKARPATIKITSLCGGDPVKMMTDPNLDRICDYYGLTRERIVELATLYASGVREVPNLKVEIAA